MKQKMNDVHRGIYHVYGLDDLILQRRHLFSKCSMRCNLSQNPSYWFSGNRHAKSKMFRDMQRTTNNWSNLQGQRTILEDLQYKILRPIKIQ